MLVDVYYNRTRKCWSVRHKNLVIDHLPRLALRDATMRVSEAARLRVIRTGKRGVHAWITGTRMVGLTASRGSEEIHYNPFKGSTFQLKSSGLAIGKANFVIFDREGRCFAAMYTTPPQP